MASLNTNLHNYLLMVDFFSLCLSSGPLVIGQWGVVAAAAGEVAAEEAAAWAAATDSTPGENGNLTDTVAATDRKCSFESLHGLN